MKVVYASPTAKISNYKSKLLPLALLSSLAGTLFLSSQVGAKDGSPVSQFKQIIPITPTQPEEPQTKDDCKNDGWMNFEGFDFQNQGHCVSYVASEGVSYQSRTKQQEQVQANADDQDQNQEQDKDQDRDRDPDQDQNQDKIKEHKQDKTQDQDQAQDQDQNQDQDQDQDQQQSLNEPNDDIDDEPQILGVIDEPQIKFADLNKSKTNPGKAKGKNK